MAPADGNDNPPEVIYGLHAVREALRAGIRPLQRLLVLGTDRQFGDIVRLAKAQRVPVHIEPRAAFDRFVPSGTIRESSAWLPPKHMPSRMTFFRRRKAPGADSPLGPARRCRRSA